ncbi:MAG: hypothetical protein H6R13_4002, partial [Proteobacteria bacterium]|nr:hypothetical protein [Pseudomonadota bacterium]
MSARNGNCRGYIISRMLAPIQFLRLNAYQRTPFWPMTCQHSDRSQVSQTDFMNARFPVGEQETIHLIAHENLKRSGPGAKLSGIDHDQRVRRLYRDGQGKRQSTHIH